MSPALERRRYLKNAYRVLLTRARQGMVIFVPPGAKRDKTRNPRFYQGVSEYLTDLGVLQV
ncbi:MAG: DNA/RNA helicase domain-containing protein [Planctomycetia bacterium]